MRIVWFSWKDSRHPAAGGAELVSHEIMKRLVRDGHQVTLITARPKSLPARETIEGIKVVRLGNRYSVYFKAYRYFKHQLWSQTDRVISEMNTIPFITWGWPADKSVLLTYQLARQVWFYQMIFPLSLIGYLLEPIYLLLMSRKYKIVLTESDSTRQDLISRGFKKESVHVFRVGMKLQPLAKLPKKASLDTVLFFGALRPMKRPLDAIKAFELACDNQPNLKLILAGNTEGSYGAKVARYVARSRHAPAITLRGRVSDDERLILMKQAALTLVTSVKEGWGLIVTEANSQGTPAIVYDTDGLRDSVINGKTGWLTEARPAAMAQRLLAVIEDPENYQTIRVQALEWSRQFTFENSYRDFVGFSQLEKGR